MYQDMANTPLDIGSMVWCMFLDEFWKDGYWISDQFIDGFYDYEDTIANLYNISDLDVQDYPQPHFKRYSDGTTLFHNVITKDTGVYSPFGSYALINKTGDIIFSNSGNKITIGSNALTLKTSNSIVMTTMDEFNSIVVDASTSSVSVTSASQIYNRTKDYVIEASTKQEKIGSVTAEYTSMYERSMSNKSEVIGGTKTLSISGDYQVSVIGGTDNFHTGSVKTTSIGIGGILTVTMDPLNPLVGITIDAGILPVFIRGSIINLG
jgi:hypothetical protein